MAEMMAQDHVAELDLSPSGQEGEGFANALSVRAAIQVEERGHGMTSEWFDRA